MEKEEKNTLNWKEIGQRFRDLRKTHALSQLEIIKMANNHKSSIAEFEAGTAPASANYALFLRNQFGASFDWLYDGVAVDRKYEDVQTKKILDPRAIGARLKEIRLEKGMTQSEFGALVGLPHATISRYEKGLHIPEIKTALKIKRALNQPLDWIYFGDEEIVPRSKMKSRLRANANQSSPESKKNSRL